MTDNRAQSLVEVLENRASQTPDRVIYQFLDAELEVSEQLTYSELLTRARAIAATEYTGYIGHEFIPKGEPVAAMKAAFDLTAASLR